MIDKVVVGPLEVNTYFIIDEDTNKGIVIDPGAEVDKIIRKIKDNNWDIQLILVTHGHYDHIGAAGQLRDELGCDIVAHKEGKIYLEDSARNLSSVFGGQGMEIVADKYIVGTEKECEEVTKDIPSNLAFQVFYAPGHTTDSAVYYFPQYKAAFVGDVIFRESVGRTDLEGGSGEDLMNSIKTQIYTLADETILYPGHGPSTTVGYEKQNNPYVNLRS